MPTSEIKHHWSRVADIGCLICQAPEPTLHHCTGGSMKRFGHLRGWSQKPSDWLVIPLHARYHLGTYGIDSGSPTFGVTSFWEEQFGTQYDFLLTVCDHVGYDVFERAGLDAQWGKL